MSGHDLTNEDRAMLIRHPMFFGLDDAVVADLIKGATGQRCQKNQLIFSTGDIATCFFMVAEGGVRLFRLDVDGSEATVNIFHHGQSFGEAAIFLERAYPVMAQTIEASRLIRVDASAIIARIKSDPALALGLLASMSSHLRGLVDEITLLRVPTAVRRAAEFLLRNCPTSEGAAEFELPHNKSLLAKRLDIAPEVLSRAFAELRKAGVTVTRKTVLIKDVETLYRLARRER